MEKTARTSYLLARYAKILNRFGADSQQAADYVEEHSGNTEFVELAELSRTLKKALTSANCSQFQRPSYSI